MSNQNQKRWGDDIDDDDDSVDDSGTPGLMDENSGGGVGSSSKSSGGMKSSLTIPPTHTSRVDGKGFKVITSYRSAHPNDPSSSSLIKTVTKVKVQTNSVYEHNDVSVRRNWKSFGEAAGDGDQSNVTILSKDVINLEDPNADTDLGDADDAGKALAGNLNAFWQKQKQRQLERKYDVDGVGSSGVGGDTSGGAEGGASGEAGGDGGGWKTVVAGGAGAAGDGPAKYIPPSLRGAARAPGSAGPGTGLANLAARTPEGGGPGGARSGAHDTRDQNTIRVTNISEDIQESDLQLLFSNYGRISRVYLAKDKETHRSRGFAFVSFVMKDDANKAMEKLQGYGYHHLILKLEWARPSAPKDPSREGTVFRSGYGQKLAQDTKEKVSFASNLTMGN